VSFTEAPAPVNDAEVDGAPAPADGVDSDDGYSTGDSDDDKNTHELSLATIEDTFKSFSMKIIKYRKSHLSARALTAMTPEKGAQRMVTINGLTEFNIQRRKREIERVNLAVKIDNAPRSQRPKLRARLRKMKPSIVASMVVANQFSKTKYWAQKLRSTARSFSETGELPENNQGKGAKHKTQFDDPGVKPRLEAFARGLVPEAEGGFKGRVGHLIYALTFLFTIQIRLHQINYGATSTSTSFRSSKLTTQLVSPLRLHGSKNWGIVSVVIRRAFITTAMNDLTLFKSEMNLSRICLVV
jgi:hypothetical protein